MKIAVGLSGGVDSAITAYLLKKEGHDIIGLTMKIWDKSFNSSNKKNSCFGPDEEHDVEDAKRICRELEVPFYDIDLSKEYVNNIIGYFKEEYMQGRTPNPCIKCNQLMKFQFLLDKAKSINIQFDKFATGHYANIEFDEKLDRYLLKKGIDEKKDQSYFLSLLSQEQLSNIIFPLGNYIKEDIKKLAKEISFFVHEKKESQDFYSGDYDELLGNLPEKGDIIDTNGKILGRHKGICYYTIGQRKGLGISYTEPLYVIEIDKKNNQIIAGIEKELYKKEFLVKSVNWISIPELNEKLTIKAKIRYMHKESPATIEKTENNLIKVIFDDPQRAIAPGQFSVFYDNDIVIGGGIIEG